MKHITRLTFSLVFSGLLILLSGCDDSDYKSGMYWLTKENNPKMAALKFQKSLEKKPKNWKTHARLIECLSLNEDADGLIKQLRESLSVFPDCTRSEAFMGNSVRVIGQNQYDLLSAGIEQRYLEKLIGKKGDSPELLSRMVITSCLVKDTVGTLGYFRRLLTSLDGEKVPADVVQEMDFLIGPSRVEWETLDWKVKRNPDDTQARLSQLNAGIVFGDSSAIRAGLRDLISRNPSEGQNPDLVKRFGLIADIDPFNTKTITKGYDASFSPDGKSIVFLRNRGEENNPDRYIYTCNIDGSNETPLLKGNQSRTPGIAMPIYSPDGKWIYFYGSPSNNWIPGRAGRFHLYRISPRYGSHPQQLTDTDLLPVVPYFTKTGRIYLVRKDIGSTKSSVEIIELNPSRESIEPVSRVGEPVTGATFSPDGDSLIFATDRGIFRRSVNGGNITVDLAWRGLDYPQMSPDGKYLLLHNQAQQLLIVNRTTGNAIFLGSVANPYATFSKDDRLLATKWINGQPRVSVLNLGYDLKDTQEFITAINR